MYKVEAFPAVVNGQAGYDVRVNDQQATVQDYIDAVNRFIDHSRCYRSRAPQMDNCFGCDLCCQERIPVTIIDAHGLSQGAGIAETLPRRFHVYVEGRVVDITMGLDETGVCRYLDRERGICTNYANRPMVCQTFICCPSTKAAKQLREEVVNAGEDELVRAWFSLKNKNGQLIINEGVRPKPDPGDYPPTPFNRAASYNQVGLKDICSPHLWAKLTKNANDARKKRFK